MIRPTTTNFLAKQVKIPKAPNHFFFFFLLMTQHENVIQMLIILLIILFALDFPVFKWKLYDLSLSLSGRIFSCVSPPFTRYHFTCLTTTVQLIVIK